MKITAVQQSTNGQLSLFSGTELVATYNSSKALAQALVDTIDSQTRLSNQLGTCETKQLATAKQLEQIAAQSPTTVTIEKTTSWVWFASIAVVGLGLGYTLAK